MLALAGRPESLKFWVYYTEQEVEKEMSQHSWVQHLEFSQHNGGSGGHALAMHKALQVMKRDDINVLLDTDMVLLVKNWDLHIRNILEDSDLFGTSHLDYGLFGLGYGEVEDCQYGGVPNTSFFAMHPRHDFSDLDLTPDKSNILKIDSVELSLITSLPINTHCHRDTGWKVPFYVKEHNLRAKIVRHRKPRHHKCAILRNEMDYSEEFVLDNIPFVAHQRGSWKRPFRKDNLSREFYDAVELYLVKIPGYIKRHGWTSDLFRAKISSLITR
ncbi:MAG: hypothetical protein AAGA64_00290 [Bacteroidota bacterium]